MLRSLICLLFFSCVFSVRAIDKSPNIVVDVYQAKLKKLTGNFEKQAIKLKKETILKLISLQRQMMRKEDLDGANAVRDLIKRIRSQSLFSASSEKVAVDIADEIGGVPLPPDENKPAPLSPDQLDAGEKTKFRKIMKPAALHKALAVLNPAYNRKAADITIEDGVITEVNFSNAGLVNISPLGGLKYVSSINLDSNPIWNLKPLAKLHLTGLSIVDTDVMDLTPLRGMKLDFLNISATKVSDISILKRMPLTSLFMARCVFIKDFSPLKRLKNLEELILPFQATKSDDIKFLEKLKKLRYIDTEWHDKKQSADEFWEKINL